jgi:phenylacetate-CoA ligase
MDEAAFHPDQLKSLNDIARVPVLTKSDIQDNRERMISRGSPRATLIEDNTGGSTGAPLKFFYDADRRDWREAATLRHDEWTGWKIGATKAILWGASQDMRHPPTVMAWLRRHMVERYSILDASSIDDAAMNDFVAQLRAKRPFLLQAYANTLGVFARYVLAHGIADLRPKAIISSAEVLTPQTRSDAEAAFGCKVFDRYGCREFAVIASQCEMHGALHVNAENLLVEVLADGVPRHDQDGEIVVTDLRNLAMPMIRYAIKDMGRLSSADCSCGRSLPLLDMAAGRVTDFLLATNGARVSGVVIATYVSTRVSGIQQMQIEQFAPGQVIVRLVAGPEWGSRNETNLRTRLQEYLGYDMRVEVTCVPAIPLEKSGKYRFSVSHIR